MSKLEDLTFVPEQFSGKVRLFPLPTLVMFPHVMQPLHIFEPRYRDMLEDALEGDRLIAMAMLAPGWEKNYEGRPAIKPVACLGRVVSSQAQPDNRYNVLLLGLRRVGLVRELAPKRSFREAEVEVYEDVYPGNTATARPNLQRKLVQAFRGILPQFGQMQQQLAQLLEANVALGMLTDIMAYTLPLELPLKEQLLGERNVDRRAKLLLKHLASSSQSFAHPDFPPKFSSN